MSVVSGVPPATPLQVSGQFIELAIVFLVLAIVAALLGARGVAGLSMRIARLFVLIFLVLAIAAYLL